MAADSLRKCTHVMRAVEECRMFVSSGKDPATGYATAQYLNVELSNLLAALGGAGEVESLAADKAAFMTASKLWKDAPAENKEECERLLESIEAAVVELMSVKTAVANRAASPRSGELHEAKLSPIREPGTEGVRLIADHTNLAMKINRAISAVNEWSMFVRSNNATAAAVGGQYLTVELGMLITTLKELCASGNDDVATQAKVAEWEFTRDRVRSVSTSWSEDPTSTELCAEAGELVSGLVSDLNELAEAVPGADPVHRTPSAVREGSYPLASMVATPKGSDAVVVKCSHIRDAINEWWATRTQSAGHLHRAVQVVLTQTRALALMLDDTSLGLSDGDAVRSEVATTIAACEAAVAAFDAGTPAEEWAAALDDPLKHAGQTIDTLSTDLGPTPPLLSLLKAKTVHVARAVSEWGVFLSKGDANGANTCMQYLSNEVDALCVLCVSVTTEDSTLSEVARALQSTASDALVASSKWAAEPTDAGCVECKGLFSQAEAATAAVVEEAQLIQAE